MRSFLCAVTAATCLAGLAKPANATTSLLQASGAAIVDGSGKPVQLKGFNLGGWFVMESYMSPMDRSGQSPDTWSVMNTLSNRFGEATERQLMAVYQQSWMTDEDIATIAAAGFNAVRIPVWWGQFFALGDQTQSGWRSDDAFTQLDAIVQSCTSHGIRVVLDMHGAIGGQSPASDTGRAKQNTYWTDPKAQANTAWMWQQIAAHYKGNATIAGYDLLNEPAPPTGMHARTAVLAAYNQLYSAIRSVDPDHMIFLEAAYGSWTLDMLPSPSSQGWTNVVYELHAYKWPTSGETAAQIAVADEQGADAVVADVRKHASWKVPVYIGEFNDFGANSSAWQYSISDYDSAGLSWTMWAYKAANGVAPNYWGYYDPYRWPARPNPSTDSVDMIAQYWSGWTSVAAFSQNTALGIIQ